MTGSAALTVPAQEIKLRDSVAEGTVVAAIGFMNRERWNPITGEVTRPRVVEVTSYPAKVALVETLPDGTHMHGPDTSVPDMRTFDWDEQVRVMRPAPIEPCECGFPARKAATDG